MAKSVVPPTFLRRSGNHAQLSPTHISDHVQLFRGHAQLHPAGWWRVEGLKDPKSGQPYQGTSKSPPWGVMSLVVLSNEEIDCFWLQALRTRPKGPTEVKYRRWVPNHNYADRHNPITYVSCPNSLPFRVKKGAFGPCLGQPLVELKLVIAVWVCCLFGLRREPSAILWFSKPS